MISTIYFIGVFTSIAMGLYALYITDDKDCDIDDPFCIVALTLISLLSWVTVASYILANLKSYRKNK